MLQQRTQTEDLVRLGVDLQRGHSTLAMSLLATGLVFLMLLFFTIAVVIAFQRHQSPCRKG